MHAQIRQKYQIIITTTATASNMPFQFLHNSFMFDRVLIDEATMVKENESIVAIKDCRQLVLIGDQQQLGPAYEFKF